VSSKAPQTKNKPLKTFGLSTKFVEVPCYFSQLGLTAASRKGTKKKMTGDLKPLLQSHNSGFVF
jgi:hypothetical protein